MTRDNSPDSEDDDADVATKSYELATKHTENDGFDSDGSDMEKNKTGLTRNQNRMLYMISLYSNFAKTAEEKESWIRRPALMVLIYEAIVEKVLDYDYAPMSRLIMGRRLYFNTSQEGASDIDFLREEKLLNGLKMSSKDFQPVTCYQISEKGSQLVQYVNKVDREAIHEVVYPPQTRDLLEVSWDTQKYTLVSENGYKRVSSVTDCEDVSYVSSAYIPQCLRSGGRPTMSNAHRAHECRPKNGQQGNLRDELDEVITLNSVSLIVAEYIPSGVNQIVQMNINLGATERVQGGFYTAKVDTNAAGTLLEVKPGLTNVSILDYSATRHLNFEADIHFPEEDGVVQVETFGCSMNSHGTMFYGMQVEAILERIKDQMSLDHLSRLLVDVHIDSSQIIDSVIAQHQRDLLQLIFDGDSAHRQKINLILANEINPHLTAEEYMDKGEYENELKQVLGETRAAFDISEHDTLVFGSEGILVAGANSRHHEPLLVSYLQLTAMDLFVRNFYIRVFAIQNRIHVIEKNIQRCHENPSTYGLIKNAVGLLSRDIILMKEILGYMRDSADDMSVPPEPPEQAGRALYDRLQIRIAKRELHLRITDFSKLMRGTYQALGFLKRMTKNLTENKAIHLRDSIGVNTKRVCDLHRHARKKADTLDMMQVIVGGMLAFDIMERVTGEWSVVNAEWMRSFVEPMLREFPFVWLVINIVFWAMVAIYVHRTINRRDRLSEGVIAVSQEWKIPFKLSSLSEFLRPRDPQRENRHMDGRNTVTRVTWTESDRRSWGGYAPTISLDYDRKSKYLLRSNIEYNRRQADKRLAFTAKELNFRLTEILEGHGVIDKADIPGDFAIPEDDL